MKQLMALPAGMLGLQLPRQPKMQHMALLAGMPGHPVDMRVHNCAPVLRPVVMLPVQSVRSRLPAGREEML